MLLCRIFSNKMDKDLKSNSICRICLSYNFKMELGKGLSLFEKYNECVISDQINALANIAIKEGDGLPDRICPTCLLDLEIAYKFKLKCENNNKILLSALNNVPTQPKTLDNDLPVKEEYLDDNDDNDFDYIEDNIRLACLQAASADTSQLEEPPPKLSKALDLKLECHDCSKSFKSKCKLRVHWKKVHMAENIKCSICLMKFKTFASLKSHKKKNLKNCTMAAATKVTHNLLPEKSRKLYEKEYNNFLAWKIEKKTTSFSENVILAYLKDLSDKFKPSSMWAKYSMLKSTLSTYNNIDITKYSKVIAFLKRSSEGHKGKKSLTFTSGQIKMFLEDSPDILYLFEKVALIFGIMGACRRQELYNIQFDEVSNIDDSTIMVKVSKTKTKIDRSFVVTGNCYAVCKKYMELRPTPCRNPAFFLSYRSGKCVDQRTGINKFGALGKTIASFLNLPNPALYTGHCFRRTSATLLIDSGGDLTALKRHGGWKSSTVAESYIDESLMNKIQVSNTILNSIENKTNEVIINIPTPSTSSTACPATATAAGSIININFQNCTIQNLSSII